MTDKLNVLRAVSLTLAIAGLAVALPAPAYAKTPTTTDARPESKTSDQSETEFELFAGNAVAVAPGAAVTATIAARAKSGFDSTIKLSAPHLPAGIGAAFSPASLTGSANAQVTFSVGAGVAAGTYLVAIDGTTPAVTRTTNVTLNVVSASFSVVASAPSVSLSDGAAGNLTVTASVIGKLSGPVLLAASGLPAGVTASFNPATLTGTGATTLSLAVGAGVAAGTYPVKVNAVAGSVSRQLQFSLLVTPAAPPASGPPTAGSIAAAIATAENNSVCKAIAPFYLEVGDQSGASATASVGSGSSGPIAASTRMSIASASKWIYGMYVVQKRGGVAGLTAQDVNFLHMTSGYTNIPTDMSGATCTAPPAGNDSIDYCLTLTGPTGPFNGYNAATAGTFDYGSGHQENHAGQFQPELNTLDTGSIGSTVAAAFGLSGAIDLDYTQPLLAGGIYASANDYTAVLRAVLSNQLLMREALGTNQVCAWVGAGCNAAYSPIDSEQWHYSIGHWVEDDASQNNDGAFSSPGAFGFYPWIDATKTYYGVIARYVPSGGGLQNGLASAQCGALVRRAFATGVQQTGATPN
jgi:hypothetical protein